MYPHRIRLVGPWEAEPIAGIGDAPAARRVVVPVRWEQFGFRDDVGVVLMRRKFGLPRRIDDWERVWVVPSRHTDICLPWQLNGTDLQWISRAEEAASIYAVPPRADVTGLLRDRNELTVRIEHAGLGAEPFGGAALDIGCRAYIRRVQVRRLASVIGLELAVDVVSENADDPLELYALIDGANCGYTKLREHLGDMTHQLRLDETAVDLSAPRTLRVDLINGATIWDTAELAISM
jgi:hypothetical protein